MQCVHFCFLIFFSVLCSLLQTSISKRIVSSFCVAGVAVAQNNWSVNYTHTYICAVRNSTVTMGCSYIYNSTNSTFHQTFWSVHSNRYGYQSSLELDRGRFQYLRETPNDCSLLMTNVTQENNGRYCIKLNTSAGKVFQDKNGVMLVVSGEIRLFKHLSPSNTLILNIIAIKCNSFEFIDFIWNSVA